MLYQFSIESEEEWSDLERRLFTAAMAATLGKTLAKAGYSSGITMSYIEPTELEIEWLSDDLADMETEGSA